MGKVEGIYIARSPQDEGLTMQDSLTALANTLKMFSHGKFTLNATPQGKKGVGKGFFKTDIEISALEDAAPAAVGNVPQAVNMAGYMTKDEAMNMARDMFKQMKTESDLEAANKRIAELEKENKILEKQGDGIGKIVDMVAPYAPHIMAKVFPQAALAQVGTLPAAADQPQTVMPNAQQQGERLSNLLETCEEVFQVPDSIDFLEKLINYVKANPHFVPMIKNMVP